MQAALIRKFTQLVALFNLNGRNGYVCVIRATTRLVISVSVLVEAQEEDMSKPAAVNSEAALWCCLPQRRCATGRGSRRGGGTPRLSSPLGSAAEAPGRGGGPLPEPGCRSLLSGAQKHPSEELGTTTTSINSGPRACELMLMLLRVMWLKELNQGRPAPAV